MQVKWGTVHPHECLRICPAWVRFGCCRCPQAGRKNNRKVSRDSESQTCRNQLRISVLTTTFLCMEKTSRRTAPSEYCGRMHLIIRRRARYNSLLRYHSMSSWRPASIFELFRLNTYPKLMDSGNCAIAATGLMRLGTTCMANHITILYDALGALGNDRRTPGGCCPQGSY